MPGKKYALAMMTSLRATRSAARYASSICRRKRKLSRTTNLALMLPRGATTASSCSGGKRGRSSCTSCKIRHSRVAAATIEPTIGPSTRMAKSTRGGVCPGVFMSSIRLMPPTKAHAPSITTSFLCSRRSRARRHAVRTTSCRYKTTRTSALRSRSTNACVRYGLLPKPSMTTRTSTPRAAAAISASATRPPEASSAKI